LGNRPRNGKNIVLLCGALLIAGGLVFALYPSEYQNNITVLKNTCADLTKNNSEERVYEPIVGQYLVSKSRTHHVSPGPNNLNLSMVFIERSGKEIDVHYSLAMEKSEYIFDKLFSVVGEANIKQKIDTNEEYGICIYRNSYNVNIGELETFMKLGEE